MRPMYILITVGLLCCGCQGTGPAKIDNPVVGPPPPRLPIEKIRENELALGTPRADRSLAASRASRTTGSARVKIDDGDSPRQYAANSIDDETAVPTGIQRVSLETIKDKDLPPFDDAMVVAMVNDQPIFAGEVLVQMRQQLKAVEEQLKAEAGKNYKPEMMYRMRAMAIRQNLPRAIERKILASAAKGAFKKNQLEGLNKAIDAEWTENIEQMMQRSKVTSINELEALLKEQGFDMVEQQATFREHKIAMNYVSFKAHNKFEPTRKEMLAYYEQHQKEYEFPARVHWQQLVISNDGQGGESEAKKRLQTVVQQLIDGADFGATIKKYGDGPKAASGGIWDWTVKGSLANKEVEQELFTLPPGEMSGVIKTATGFQIVQVIDRQEAGCQPFESLQKDIENKLKNEVSEELAKAAIDELKKAAIVKTIFDDDKAAKGQSEKPVSKTAERSEDDEI